MSLLAALFEGRARPLKTLVRCTPVVWTGGPRFVKPPNKSVKPPRAVRLVRAFRAPGFESNWASGIADAKAAADVAASVDDGPVVLAPPFGGFAGALTLLLLFVKLAALVPFVAEFPDCSCVRFAFCSSTLWDKRKDRKIFVWLEGYLARDKHTKRKKINEKNKIKKLNWGKLLWWFQHLGAVWFDLYVSWCDERIHKFYRIRFSEV